MEGDQHKIRKALERIIKWFDDGGWDEEAEEEMEAMLEFANSALSEPARQCDVGTAEEQFDRFAKHCIDKNCDSCEHGIRGRSLAHCALAWAQSPYE